ncbi:hypothetical protein GC167_03125 [bacterium]|nr:hypothetical protein [bacterium]
MKFHATLLFLVTLLTLGGCKSKKAAESTEGAKGIEAPVKKPVDRWVVTFHSEGSGPDNSAMRLLEAKMVEWNQQYRWELNPERIGWGKEGEIDYCFPLDQFRDFAAQRLDALFKETFGDNRKVHWSVYPDCPHAQRGAEISKP